MATIKDIFDPFVLLETKYNSGVLRLLLQAQRNDDDSLQHRETRTTEQAIFFSHLVLCVHIKMSTVHLQIKFFPPSDHIYPVRKFCCSFKQL